MAEFHWGSILLGLHIIAVALCIVRVLYKQRNTGAAFAWLIVLLAFPLAGVVLYVLLGEPRLGAVRERRTAGINQFYDDIYHRYLAGWEARVGDRVPTQYGGISHVSAAITGMQPTKHNGLQLLTTTDEIIDAMLADIHAANDSCLLGFYIINPQGRAKEVLQAVILAAKRGVDCTILADAVGSADFFRSSWPNTLKTAGVKVQAALPVGVIRSFFTRTDLRNHRKLLIVDKQTAYTGSFNLVDPQYFKQGVGVGEWVDVMMRCTGPIVLEMAAVFFADFAVEAEQNLESVKAYLSGYAEKIPQTMPDEYGGGNVVAQVIPSAPDQQEHVIYDTILCAIYSAQRNLTITTPYFVPDAALLTALTSAARRGVEVRLILPEKVDSKMVRYASRAYYRELLEAGVKIGLFQGGLLHAKTLTVDHDYALFGTVNMDMRSFFLNLEISLAIYDNHATQEIAACQQQYWQHSRLLDAQEWLERSKWWGLLENAVRLIGPLL